MRKHDPTYKKYRISSIAFLAAVFVLLALMAAPSVFAAPDTVIIAGAKGTTASSDLAFWWTGKTATSDVYIKGFYYRLGSQDWNWTRERVIAYYGLPNGSYRLEVKAVDSNNVEDSSPAARSFVVQSSFDTEPDEAPFSVRRDFGTYLDSGIISEGLRQEFSNNGRTLSQNAVVSIVTTGTKWLITDGVNVYRVRKEGNLLNIYQDDLQFRLDSELEDDLNDANGAVSEDLRTAFEDKDVLLSSGATISKNGDYEWLVDGKYTVRKESGRLNVYQEELKFSVELLTQIINYLNNRAISEGLRSDFNDADTSLSTSANVSVVTQNTKWLIADSGKTYIIIKEADKLSIFESINDTASEAIFLTPGKPIKCLSQPDSDDSSGVDKDWFRVRLEAQSGQPDPQQMTVFFRRPNAQGTTTVEIYRYPNISQKIGILEVASQDYFATGITPGDYLISVTPSGESSSAEYFLTAAADSLVSGVVWDREQNNVSSDANESASTFLSSGSPWIDIAGSKWSSSDSRDWFRFYVDVNKPTRLSVNLTSPRSGSTSVTLYPAALLSSPMGRFSVTSGSGSQWKLETGVVSGEYLLEVDLSQHDIDSPYFLSLLVSDFPAGEFWEQEPNDPFDFANNLPIGVRVRGAKSDADDANDWFRLAIPNDGILNLTTSRILGSGAVDIYLLDPVLLNPVGSPIAYDVQEEFQKDYLNVGLLAGEYLLKVNLSQIAGDYWFIAQFITSVEHDAPEDDALTVGDVLTVKVVWKSGNTAVYDVIIVPDDKPLNVEPIAMYDDGLHNDGGQNDGVYVGTYTIEDMAADGEEEDYVKDARVIVHLRDQVGNTADIAIPEEFVIDVTPPDMMPPEIFVVTHNAQRALRVGEELTVTIQGEAGNAATFDIGDLAKGLIAYDDGKHSDGGADDGKYVGTYMVKAEDYVSEAVITGYLADESGNASSLEAVIPVDIVGNRPVIDSVDHTGRLTLGKDDTLKVTLMGDPDGIASFDIAGLISGVPMYDDGLHDDGARGDGKYVGTYKVADGDGVIGALVTAHLLDRRGLETTKIAVLTVNIDAVAPAPVLGVQAHDRPGDQGGFISLSWNPSAEIDFDHYNVYLSKETPIAVSSGRVVGLSPVISDITSPGRTSLNIEVEADLTDYFVAVTAVDIMGNESLLDENRGSEAGPVQAFDNLKPTPVKVVQAVDRGQDFGGVIVLSWTNTNLDADFVRYNIYQDTQPILSIEGLIPVDSISDRYVKILDMLVEADLVDYYFAVTAVDLSGNESDLDAFGGSVAGPASAENNIGPEPEGPARFLSGPVGTIHYSNVAFHWSKFRLDNGVARANAGYYFRLDGANWQWTTDSTAVYYDLSAGNHTFSVRVLDGADLSSQTTISRSFTVESVSASEQEPNDSKDAAQIIRSGMNVKGDSSDGSDDWFRIHVPANQPGVMDMLFSRPNSVGSTKVILYANQPFREIGQFDSIGGQPGHLAIGVAQESDYFVHVDSAGDNSQYRLAVSFDKLPSGFFWELEDNDSAAMANALDPQGVEVRGIGGNHDQDWFKVHVPDIGDIGNPVWMNISFHRPDAEALTSVKIYSSFPIIETRQIGEFSANFSGVVERGGDYFIKVDNGDEPPSSVYYFLLSLSEIPVEAGIAWEVEPNNLVTYANPVLTGVKRRGTSWDGDNDDDWYVLDTRQLVLDGKDQKSVLNLHFSRPSGIGSSVVELYNAASQLMGSFEVDIASAQTGSINAGVGSGLYYVKIRPENEIPSAVYELTALLVKSISLKRVSAEGGELESGDRPLRAGDKLQLVLVWGIDGGSVTFDIGDIASGLPMAGQGGGAYAGTYTVAEGDDEANAPITLYLEDPFGNAAEMRLDETVTVDTTPPRIFGVTHDAITPLSAGKTLTVRMVGDPRSRARFDIAGFSTGIDMYNMTASEANPPLMVLNWDWRILDTGYPMLDVLVSGEVRNVSDSTKSLVKVTVTFYDANGNVVSTRSESTVPSSIPPGVTAAFEITPQYVGSEKTAKIQLIYGTDQKIAGESADEGVYFGYYEVVDGNSVSDAQIICYLTDSTGNQSTASAKDTVTFDSIAPVITALTHNADKILVEGDTLTVTLEGEANGEAFFDIGAFRTGLKMPDGEISAGKYAGTYRVKAGDNVSDALITGYLKDAAGNEAVYTAVRSVTINTSTPGISTVTHNGFDRPFIEGETLIVKVSTDPGSKVTFDVDMLVNARPMYDDGKHDDDASGDGVYSGSYTIRKGDNVKAAKVKATVVSLNGKTVIREAFETVSVDTEPPPPVAGVSALDKPDDEGCCIVLSWTPSDADDFDYYNIYQSDQPIISLRDLEPIDVDALDREISSIEIFLPAPVPGFPIPAYYFAVTAVDLAKNESLITRESTDGPASGLDDLPPPPVEKVSGYDRAYDNGKIITIVWSDPSPAEDFYRYNIYMDTAPIVSTSSLVPVDASITNRNILTADISVLEDGLGYFFAVTAQDTSGNESQIAADSVAGPIASVDNLGVPPDTLVKIISGPVGEVHHDDVTFRWNRWFRGQMVDARGVVPLSGYYYKLDNGNWTWTNETYKTYYDLKEGEHTFYIRADLGTGASDPLPASRMFAVKRLSLSEVEPNGGYSSANWISKGNTIVGANSDDGDDDWYRFHVEADSLITLDFNRMGGIGSTSVTVFRSLPPTQASSIGTLTADPMGQRQSFSTAVDLGDYFILVDSQGEDPNAKYEISVTTSEMPRDIQWDKENNDQAGTAQLVNRWELNSVNSADAPAVEVSGFGNRAGDVDWYRLQISGLQTGASVFMNMDFVRPQGAGYTEMSIYASFPVTESPKIGLITLQPSNGQIQRLSIPVKSGDYYLKIDNSQEADLFSLYSFRVSFAPTSGRWEMEPNGVLQFANQISVGELVKGTSWHPNDDLDWFKVRLSKRGTLVLSYFRPFGSGTTNISLKTASGADIASDSAGVFTGQKATIVADLNLGDYLIVLDPENEEDASAEYQLVVTVLDLVELDVTALRDTYYELSQIMSVGDTIKLTAAWKPGNVVSFDIGDLRAGLPVYDDGAHGDGNVGDGVYVGTYTVQAGDDISDAEIRLHLGMPPALSIGNPLNPPYLGDYSWTADLSLEERVNIDTTPPKILKVSHNVLLRPLRAGESLNVTVTGESGAFDAFFDILLPGETVPGVARYTEIPLVEASSGVYNGSYTLEERDDLVTASVVCHLIDAAGNESLKSSDRPISFDTTPPEIFRIEHDADEVLVIGDVLTVKLVSDTVVGKATFSVAGLFANRAMYDNGMHGDSIAGDGIYTGQYTVSKGDNVSEATVSASLTDEAGNTSEGVAFEPISVDTAPPEIISLVHDAYDILSEGDMLTVTLKGDPGNFAVFDIGSFQTGLPMYDDGTRFDQTANDGVYIGTYTVKKGDSAQNARITGYLTDKNNNQTVYRVFERVNIDAVPPPPVVGVQASDRPDDQGHWIVLSWQPSAAEDFDHYNIYRELAPITSVQGLTPLSDDALELESVSANRAEVIVPANKVNYYLAVTVSDRAGNESPVDKNNGMFGPVQALDNIAPEPVSVVSASDLPNDQGRTIVVSWTKPSTSEDFSYYGVYRSENPIVSLDGLTPVMKPTSDDTRDIPSSSTAGAGLGVYVTVPYDDVDFYFAVTAFDVNGNESPLDSQGGSAAGPVQSTDDTPPKPVIVVDVVDRANDSGLYLDVIWETSTDEGIQKYNFYLSSEPIDRETIKRLQPADVVDISAVAVWNSIMSYELATPVDLFGFYVAIAAVDFGGNVSLLDSGGESVAGPAQSVSNTVLAGAETSIFAGFDFDAAILIPAGAIADGETVDILWPEEATFQKIDEANRFLEKSHIDEQVDSYFADTVREFLASTANIIQPVRITLSYPDVSDMGTQTSVGTIGVSLLTSQDDEKQFRIFRLNEASRIPRWELVPGLQKVNTTQNTVSVQVNKLGVFRVARLKLPANFNRVVVYPNPFIPSQSLKGYITFKNLTENASIKIYSMAGEHVRTIEKIGGGDEATWNVRNSEGDEVASGTYVFVIENAENTLVDKIVILR